MTEAPTSFDEIRRVNLDKLHHKMEPTIEVLAEVEFAEEERAQLRARGASFSLEVTGAPEHTLVRAVTEHVIFQQ